MGNTITLKNNFMQNLIKYTDDIKNKKIIKSGFQNKSNKNFIKKRICRQIRKDAHNALKD